MITGKTFYAVDTCEEPNYYSEKYTESKFILQIYSDDTFTDEIEKRTYLIKELTDDNFILVKDDVEYICALGYEYLTDSKKVTEITLDCLGDNDDEDFFLIAPAYPTKELAIKNKNTDCD